MLPPDYYDEISQGAEAVAEELHENIIRKIIRRLIARMKRYKFFKLSQTDKWAIETLQESGYLREDIAKEIAKMTGRQARTIRKAFEEAAVKNLEWDDAVYKAAGLSPDPLKRSPFLIRLLQRGYEKTNKEWFNYTRTTADAAQRLFISECDKAYNLVATGAESLQTAVADAIENVSSAGVEVVYPSGHKDTIETATARAVRTGVAQACGDITTARMDEMDWDIVLVSAHLGARVTDKEDFTNHYWWQGQFYSRSGKDPRFKPFSVCGEGDVQGILGANCRHSYSPGDGKFNPFEKFDSEENKKRYQNEQKQRSMERAIRKSKRELIGLKEGIDATDDPELKATLQEKFNRKARTIKNQYNRYEAFSKDNGLKMQYERANIPGWTGFFIKAVSKA